VGLRGALGRRGLCIAVAAVPTSLGRVARGSAGGSCKTTQAPEQQRDRPLSYCQRCSAGIAAICLGWRILQGLWEAVGWGGEGEGSWEIGEAILYKICQFLFILLKRVILFLTWPCIYIIMILLHSSDHIILFFCF